MFPECVLIERPSENTGGKLDDILRHFRPAAYGVGNLWSIFYAETNAFSDGFQCFFRFKSNYKKLHC
ncbi:hypothetical protein BWD08_01195 [Neisseria animaloris]|nr:hypothetical protein BWD08_01195 [Neisseria animaloris]